MSKQIKSPEAIDKEIEKLIAQRKASSEKKIEIFEKAFSKEFKKAAFIRIVDYTDDAILKEVAEEVASEILEKIGKKQSKQIADITKNAVQLSVDKTETASNEPASESQPQAESSQDVIRSQYNAYPTSALQ